MEDLVHDHLAQEISARVTQVRRFLLWASVATHLHGRAQAIVRMPLVEELVQGGELSIEVVHGVFENPDSLDIAMGEVWIGSSLLSSKA
jgi:hypothetical protein